MKLNGRLAGAKRSALTSGAAAVLGGGAVFIARRQARSKRLLGISMPAKATDLRSLVKQIGKASKQVGRTSQNVGKDIQRLGEQAEQVGKTLS